MCPLGRHLIKKEGQPLLRAKSWTLECRRALQGNFMTHHFGGKAEAEDGGALICILPAAPSESGTKGWYPGEHSCV